MLVFYSRGPVHLLDFLFPLRTASLIDLKMCEALVHPTSGSTGCKEACAAPRELVLRD